MTQTTILLSGSLAKAFGREHRRQLDTGSVQEAFRALKHTLPGFEAHIRAMDRRGLRYAIFRNRRNVGEDAFSLGGTNEIRIVPLISGSKRGGLMQVVLGAVMVAVGTFVPGVAGTPWGVGLQQAGVAMMVGGVMQMLSPQAKGLKGRESPDNQPSYAFGGPVNTIAQGNPVGVLYGRRRIGGAIVSAGIFAEDQL